MPIIILVEEMSRSSGYFRKEVRSGQYLLGINQNYGARTPSLLKVLCFVVYFWAFLFCSHYILWSIAPWVLYFCFVVFKSVCVWVWFVPTDCLTEDLGTRVLYRTRPKKSCCFWNLPSYVSVN